jgi:hypothetical protein
MAKHCYLQHPVFSRPTVIFEQDVYWRLRIDNEQYLKNVRSVVYTTPKNSRHPWMTRIFGVKVRTLVSVMLARISRGLFTLVVVPNGPPCIAEHKL